MDESGAEELRKLIHAFIRGFGLLDQARTPCGQPIAVSAAHALMELLRNEGIDQLELANRLGLSKSAVSRLLAGIERREWVRRERSENDGRARLLYLTPKGKRLAAKINRESLSLFSNISASLPNHRKKQLFEGLSSLLQAIPERKKNLGRQGRKPGVDPRGPRF